MSANRKQSAISVNIKGCTLQFSQRKSNLNSKVESKYYEIKCILCRNQITRKKVHHTHIKKYCRFSTKYSYAAPVHVLTLSLSLEDPASLNNEINLPK